MAPEATQQQQQQQEQEQQQPESSTPTSSLEEPLLPGSNHESSSETLTATNKDVILPACGREPIRVNHNVLLNLILAVLYGISGSLWNGTAYAAYLKKLGKDQNEPFGNIEAAYGLATLVTALPVGYLADRLGRSKVIAFGGILLFVTTFFQASVIQWVGTDLSNQHRNEMALWLFGLASIFWGLGDGVVNGPCSALYADSTPEGERSVYYNYLFACYCVATSVGPLVSIILFQTLGDDWSIHDLKVVIFVGLGMELFNSILMMLFDDKKALDEPSSEEPTTTAPTTTTTDGDIPETNFQDEPTNDTVSNETSLKKRQQWIPYIIFVFDLVNALGSGMTIKFFPLFFKDEVGMSPSQVQLIFCITPLAMVIFSTLGSKIASTGVGRVQTQMFFSISGVSCLYIMVFFKTALSRHPLLLIPIYVLRTSLMNGSYPLQESILMDFVPKEVRARWKSLDSVASFGWCGSAALGGWLADKYDYTYSFLITAILQSTAILVWSLLLPLVPRKEGDTSASSDGTGDGDTPEEGSTTLTNNTSAMEEPLLGSS